MSSWPRARKRIPRQSAKQAKKNREWQKVRAEVIARDETCRAAGIVPHLPCQGRAEVHHLRNRSQGGKHEADGCILVCSVHHEWIGLFPEKASELGLLILRPDAEAS